jgi:hypothetical protein
MAFTDVAEAIAALSVSGVTLKDIDAIPEKVEARDCPILFPRPNEFVTDYELEINSFGSAAAKKTERYKLNYVFLHAPIGAERGLFATHPDLVANARTILSAFRDNDALGGAVDIQPSAIASFGPTQDPSGNTFHGCIITLSVTEFVN